MTYKKDLKRQIVQVSASVADLGRRIESYNKWRRGGSGPMPEPRMVGLDLDTVAKILKRLSRKSGWPMNDILDCEELSAENDNEREKLAHEHMDQH